MLPARLLAATVLCQALVCQVVVTPASAEETEVRLQENPVAVLELFTSQGCSSCPPADALLAELGAREDVLALAYHVDYWDYIGWRDTFGSPEHTELQRSYVESWGRSRLYTPQLVVNGREGVVGSHEEAVIEALDAARMPLSIALGLDAGSEIISVSAEGRDGATEAVVWLVPYVTGAEVSIERGENEGQLLAYTHVAGARRAVGVWDPVEGMALRLPLDEALADSYDGAVVLIQEKRGNLPGSILGAAAFSR